MTARDMMAAAACNYGCDSLQLWLQQPATMAATACSYAGYKSLMGSLAATAATA
jgi:hypothetical protein